MSIVRKIINVLTTLIIVLGGTFLILYICGIVPYVVLSGSMEPTIKTGSLCFINRYSNFNDIKEKDIVAFKLENGTLVTHRAIEISDSGITTKGDRNKEQDGSLVTKNNYVGKNILWIPKIGYLVMAFQSTRGEIVLLTFILLLFIIGILFGDNKKEK
ncbi:MAG: signal peptidase I [Bacilli bacterium]|nr:signal peptidase I [Bacilli bacterium]